MSFFLLLFHTCSLFLFSRGVADVIPFLPYFLGLSDGVDHGGVSLFVVIFRQFPVLVVLHEIDGAIRVAVIDGIESGKRQRLFTRFGRKRLSERLRSPTVETTTFVTQSGHVSIHLCV